MADSGAFNSSRGGDRSASDAMAKIVDDRRKRLMARISGDAEATATVIANGMPLATLWKRFEPWRTPVDAADLAPPAAIRAALRMALLCPDDTTGTTCKLCGHYIRVSSDRHVLASHHGRRNPPHAELQRVTRAFLAERGLAPTV